jgi:hypothetical protein
MTLLQMQRNDAICTPGKDSRRIVTDDVQHANCPAKSYYFPATREAGFAPIEDGLSNEKS